MNDMGESRLSRHSAFMNEVFVVMAQLKAVHTGASRR